MITGAHIVLHTADAEADRAFFRDVLKFPSVDAGHGWLIFALPPSELACHPASVASHELYLMTDDIDVVVAVLDSHGVTHGELVEERWGRLVRFTLPSGVHLGIYQPKHPRP